MYRKSDNFPLVLTGGALALWLLLHKIFDIFFEDWIKHQLEPFVGHTVAEMIERFGSAGFPALAAGGIVWFLYSYIKSHLRAEAPDPLIEAQRQHTAAILAQTEALKLSVPFIKDGAAEIPVYNFPIANLPSPDFSDMWKPAPEAVEAFAESDLIAVRDKQGDLFNEGYMKTFEIEDEIREIQKKFENWRSLDTTTLEGRTLKARERGLEVYRMQTADAKDGLRQAWDALRVDIESKLTRGHLIAKGFRSPHVAGSAEVEIPMAEWRIMDLNNVTSEAVKKGSNDILYSGVVLRRVD